MPLRKLEPEFHERVWGSTQLEPWFPDPASPVGPAKAIGEVWHEVPTDLPLLVKFLFTTKPLSIQVHPDNAYARAHHDSPGKTEMWHVIDVRPCEGAAGEETRPQGGARSAQIAAGFRETVTAEQVRSAALSPHADEIEGMLEWFDAAPHDTFLIPAGVVHTIGAGLVLCEIQQPSDITFRIYDYGRGRALHLDEALAVAQFSPHSARAKLPVACDYFVTSRLTVHGQVLYRPMTGQPQLLIAIHGQGEIDGHPLKAGDVWYVPGDSGHMPITGEVTLLRALVPRH
jgi:mannose-6-phosphate isomerase